MILQLILNRDLILNLFLVEHLFIFHYDRLKDHHSLVPYVLRSLLALVSDSYSTNHYPVNKFISSTRVNVTSNQLDAASKSLLKL